MRARLNQRNVLIHGSAAVLVVLNWGTFIWASINGHVAESGLGYLIAPFIAIGTGAFILGDCMSVLRRCLLFIIALCVLVLILRSAELDHWVYLTIGLTWGSYACLKKLTSLDAFDGLFCETVVLSALLPVLLMLLPSLTMQLPPALPGISLALLALCGFISVMPLWLFAKAASALPLSVMGIFQFVLPTTQLIVALWFYHQPISANTILCFSAIWLALLLIVGEPFLHRFLLIARKDRS